MRKDIAASAMLALALIVTPSVGWTQEAPAVAQAQGADKERLKVLIAAAAKEGQVNYIDTMISPVTHDAMAAGFRKYYGVPASFKVGHMYNGPSPVITRLQQELNASRVTFDVGAVASPGWVNAQYKAGHFMQYDSPEYANYQKSIDQQMGIKGSFVLNCAYTFAPGWNSDTLQFEGNSYKDVLKLVGKLAPGRTNTADSELADSTLMVHIGMRKALGPEYFEELAKLKPSFYTKAEQGLTRLTTGEDLFSILSSTSRTMMFNLKGAKLKFMEPKEGFVMLPQFMFILKQAPNPNAAKLWFDFVLSDEGQKIFVSNEFVNSGRSNFQSPVKEAPGLDDVKQVSMDWLSFSDDEFKKARAEWVKIFKQKQ
jgi:iron(III) transport system substrate-binding protein